MIKIIQTPPDYFAHPSQWCAGNGQKWITPDGWQLTTYYFNKASDAVGALVKAGEIDDFVVISYENKDDEVTINADNKY